MDTTVCMAQIEVRTGDINGNTRRILAEIAANDGKATFIVFPELAVSGYCCGSLFESREFIESCAEAVRLIAEAANESVVIVGAPRFAIPAQERSGALRLHNSLFAVKRGSVSGVYDKTLLANDYQHEDRKYFIPGNTLFALRLTADGKIGSIRGTEKEEGDVDFGMLDCEDIWYEDHDVNLVRELKERCPTLDLILVGNFSYFHADKTDVRRSLLSTLSRDNNVAICYLNAVGIGDFVKNIIAFDGGSWVFNRFGHAIAKLPDFESASQIVEINDDAKVTTWPVKTRVERMWEAILYTIRKMYDYLNLDAFVAISGGLDSAIVAVACAKALGTDRLRLVTMPSRANGTVTLGAAAHVAEALGVDLCVAPIEATTQETVLSIEQAIGYQIKDESQQPRNLSMVWTTAQAVGRSVLALEMCHVPNPKTGRKYGICATGNHTENVLSWFSFHDVGSIGLVQPLGDMTKTEEFALAAWINAHYGVELIPEGLFNGKIVPMAELADSSVDPFDYYLMSGICAEIIRERKSPSQLRADFESRNLTALYFPGDKIYDYDAAVFDANVKEAWWRSKISVGKQAQSAPGLILSKRARGLSSREPILNFYEG